MEQSGIIHKVGDCFQSIHVTHTSSLAADAVGSDNYGSMLTLRQNQQAVEDLFNKVSSESRSSLDQCLDLEVDFCLIKNSMLLTEGPNFKSKLKQLSELLESIRSGMRVYTLRVICHADNHFVHSCCANGTQFSNSRMFGCFAVAIAMTNDNTS